MESIPDWENLLKQNRIFPKSYRENVDQLIRQLIKIGNTRYYPEGRVILAEGRAGDNLFLIGEGSVRVSTRKESGDETLLTLLNKGDFFGEMALLEQKPRAATVTANEYSVLLEIEGKAFLDLLRTYSEIAFEILINLSTRLRHTNEQVMGMKMRDFQEKLNLLNNQLDTEIRAVETRLEAAQVVFDETKNRTNDVIQRADETIKKSDEISISAAKFWTQLKWVVYPISFIVFVLFVLTGIDISKYKTEIESYAKISRETVEKLKPNLPILERIFKLNQVINNSLIAILKLELTKGNEEEAKRSFQDLLGLRDSSITNRLLNEIEAEISRTGANDKKRLKIYKNLLGFGLDLDLPEGYRERVIAQCLLLAILILDEDDNTFTKYSGDLEKYVASKKNQKLSEPITLSLVDQTFQVEKDGERKERWQERWTKVKKLIPR